MRYPRGFGALVLMMFCLFTLAADKSDKPARAEVAIVNLEFNPGVTRIHVGDTVTWTNKDSRDHTVIAKDGTFHSDNLKAGQTFEFTFTKAGKFEYGCTYHPRMKAMIIVE